MPPQKAHQGAKQSLVSGKAIRLIGCEAGKQPSEMPGQQWVARDRSHNLDRPGELLLYLGSHKGWVKIDHPPSAHAAVQGCAVVHLTGVRHDHIAS
jgi:hypothetical protein